jgi:predicted TIM-barrel fold metal-dependent hydrolase
VTGSGPADSVSPSVARAIPLAGLEPLIDVHAHFYHAGAGRTDWEQLNGARFRAGDRIGVTCHVGSVLGSYGFTSPTYFPSPDDVTRGNDAMLAIAAREPHRTRMLVTVNPNYTGHALAEVERCVSRGAIGVKLLASRRADDRLLDPIAHAAGARGLPVLHHIWQHRQREWPSQEISDGADLARLAGRHPGTSFILAHIGGGGDWAHTFPAVADHGNIYPDLSGSGVDRGMLDAALATLGPQRLLWACDLTMETGLAKLRGLEVIGISADELSAIRWGNAQRIFPPNAFPMLQSQTGEQTPRASDRPVGQGAR